MANAQQDLVIRMKTNSTEFNQGVDKAKGKLNEFKREGEGAGKNIADGFSKVAVYVAAAVSAFKTFEGVIRSTEQGTDALDRSMYSLKSSINLFMQSLSNGSLAAFTTDLQRVVTAAKDAYNAIDALGTMKMWNKVRINQLNTQIAEQRVIANSKKSTQAEKDEANRLISMYVDQMKVLTTDLLGSAQNAAKKKLREMAGVGSEYVSDAELEGFVWAWEHGELKEMADQLYQQFATETHAKGWTMGGGGSARMPMSYDIKNVTWSAKDMEERWRAMTNLLTANEKTEWQIYYNLLDEENTIRQGLAATELKANRTTEKGSGNGSGDKSESVGLTFEQILEYERYAFQNEILNNDRIKDSQLVEIKVLDEEIEEPELDALIEKYKELKKAEEERIAAWLKQMEYASIYADTLGYVSNIFQGLSDIVADTSPWKKYMNVLSAVMSSMQSLISTYTSLVAAAIAAEAMEAGESLPFPYNVAMIAAAGAALISVISAIRASAKSQHFAGGGIVGGNDYHDGIHAQLSSREMVLNQHQQLSLWKMIAQGASTTMPAVRFVIEGEDLVGVMDNYNKNANY